MKIKAHRKPAKFVDIMSKIKKSSFMNHKEFKYHLEQGLQKVKKLIEEPRNNKKTIASLRPEELLCFGAFLTNTGQVCVYDSGEAFWTVTYHSDTGQQIREGRDAVHFFMVAIFPPPRDQSYGKILKDFDEQLIEWQNEHNIASTSRVKQPTNTESKMNSSTRKRPVLPSYGKAMQALQKLHTDTTTKINDRREKISQLNPNPSHISYLGYQHTRAYKDLQTARKKGLGTAYEDEHFRRITKDISDAIAGKPILLSTKTKYSLKKLSPLQRLMDEHSWNHKQQTGVRNAVESLYKLEQYTRANKANAHTEPYRKEKGRLDKNAQKRIDALENLSLFGKTISKKSLRSWVNEHYDELGQFYSKGKSAA